MQGFLSCIFYLYNPKLYIKILVGFQTEGNHRIIRRIGIMAYVIGDDCANCGSCAAVCPAEAISEGDGKYVIDADACLECGTCEAECPTGAITAE